MSELVKIPFNKAPNLESSKNHVISALESQHLAGDGFYSQKVMQWFEAAFDGSRAFLTPSCTAALELSAILLDINAGDEVIMPSFNFPSAANAFVLRKAKIKFVDIDPNTMNLNPELLTAAVNKNTKAIVPIHYAGLSSEMNHIKSLADPLGIKIVEDAAQCISSKYDGKPVGIKGQMSTLSFHETKNVTSGGEGGLLIINDPEYIERAEIIREKGTNRKQFFRGMVNKYSWVDIGSSYLPGELQAAHLFGQLEQIDTITKKRLALWNRYYDNFKQSSVSDYFDLPLNIKNFYHNGHIFYIKLSNLDVRAQLICFLKQHSIDAVFHYIPLHSSKAGQRFGEFVGEDVYTTTESEKLLRLPLFYDLQFSQVDQICELVIDFFRTSV